MGLGYAHTFPQLGVMLNVKSSSNIIFLNKWHFLSAKAAPFRVEFISDAIEVMKVTTTIADIASKGLKLAFWQNSC